MRVNNEYLDSIIGQKIKILDKGFIRVIDYMGDESSIVQAARVSYGSGKKSKEEDIALIDFLMRHEHTSPFEMCEIKLHVKLPIFIARQWIRHRTANVNELSARYSLLNKDFYEPECSRINAQSLENKQDSSCEELNNSEEIVKKIVDNSDLAYSTYEELIAQGLSKEVARICLSLNYYTEMYWKIDLHNLLHFLKLRIGSGAQREIRAYAESILQIIKFWLPNVYVSFENHSLKSCKLSCNSLTALQEALAGKKITQKLSKNEIATIKKYFGSDLSTKV